MDIKGFKEQYPAYQDIDDDRLAEGLHRKYYQDKISYPDFREKVGLSRLDKSVEPGGIKPSEFEADLQPPKRSDMAETVTGTPPTPENQPSPDLPGADALKETLSPAGKTLQQIGQVYPVLEAAAAWTTQPAALALSGLAGLTTDMDQESTEKMMRGIQETVGYQPMTEEGKEFTKTTFYPFEKLHEAASKAGGKTLEETESPEWATFVHTLIEGAPALLMGGRTGGRAARGVGSQVAKGVRAGFDAFKKTKAGKRYQNLTRKQRVKAAEKAGRDLSDFMNKNPDMTQAEIAKLSKQTLGKYFEEMRKARATGEKPGPRTGPAVQKTDAPPPTLWQRDIAELAKEKGKGKFFDAMEKKPKGLEVLEEKIPTVEEIQRATRAQTEPPARPAVEEPTAEKPQETGGPQVPEAEGPAGIPTPAEPPPQAGRPPEEMTTGELQAEIDEIQQAGRGRMDAATEEMRGLRPSEIDWMTERESNRLAELKRNLPKVSRQEAQERVEAKREARRQEAEKPAEEPTKFFPGDTAYLRMEATGKDEPVNFRGYTEDGQAVVVKDGQQMPVDAGELKAQPEEAPAAPEAEAPGYERRTDLETRKKIDQMSVEEMRKALKTDELTGLKNKRAYNEAEKLPVQASMDVDALKWVNDNLSHEAGDSLLQTMGRALQNYSEAYHVSGDEFILQGNSEAEIQAAVDEAQNFLNNREIVWIDESNNEHILRGSFSYGTGKTLSAAEKRLQEHKTQREATGDRPRRGEKPAGYRQRTPERAADRPGEAKPEIAERPEGPAEPQTVKELKNTWSDMFDKLQVTEKSDSIRLGNMVVPEGKRGIGIGSQFMQDLTSYADRTGKRVTLDPATKADRQGTTSKDRLTRFYERFGFVKNKGKNRNYEVSDDMYREPTGAGANYYIGDRVLYRDKRGRESEGVITREDKSGNFAVKIKEGDSIGDSVPPEDIIELREPGIERLKAERGENTPVYSAEVSTAEADRLTMKQQKDHLIRLTDKAYKDAPEVLPEDTPLVKIEVPADGEFSLFNTKSSIAEFKKKARKNFPGTDKPVDPYKTTKPSTKPSQSRIVGDNDGPVEYYNEFKPRKRTKRVSGAKTQEVMWKDGFYSNGEYVIKLDKKPNFTKTEQNKLSDRDPQRVFSETKGEDRPAELLGEMAGKETVATMPDTALVHARQTEGLKNEHLYQAKYIDNILSNHPNAEPFIKDGSGVLVFKDNGQPVGGVGPLSIHPYHLITDYQRQRMREIHGEDIQTPGEGASEAGYASDRSFASDASDYTGPHGDLGNVPYAMDMPEIVELARELLNGKHPRVKRYLKKQGAAGIFYPRGGQSKIELVSAIFEDPEMARKVLAHEVGHLVDYLPDQTLKRGNLLGRVASLKSNMKGKIPLDPQKPPKELTKQRKEELLAEARKLAKAEADKIIDKEVERQLAITPDDVMTVWNSLEAEGFSKEFTDYIKRLDTKQKKSIVKEALNGRVAPELQQFAKTIKETKRERAGGYHQKLSKIYKDLIEKEMEHRQYLENTQVREELKNFTQLWKPFDPNTAPKSYLKYRFSGEELYADAISALITNPSILKKNAPKFYEGFFNYLDNNPPVQENYQKIQDFMSLGEEELAQRRADNLRAGFEKGREARRKQLKKKREQVDDKWETLAKYIDDANAPLYLRVIKPHEWRTDSKGNLTPDAKKARELRNLIEGNANFATKAQIYTLDVLNKVIEPMKEKGLDVDDLSYLMFQKRVIGERFNMANPGGHYAELSKRDLSTMTRKWGPEKTRQLNSLIWEYRTVREEVVLPKIQEGGIVTPKLMEHLWNTKDYATFDVVKFLQDEFGKGSTSRIHPQYGTLAEVGNLLEATMVKDVKLMRAAENNRIKQKFMEVAEPDGIARPAELKYSKDAKKKVPEEPQDPGEAIMTVLYDGQPQHYYIPKEIASVFEYDPIQLTGWANVMQKVGMMPRALFTSYNPVFIARNPVRDFQETLKKLPEVQIRNAPQLAKLYKEAWPEVVDLIFRGKMSPDIRAMSEKGMIPKTRMWGHKDPTVSGEISDLIEETTLEFDKASKSEVKSANDAIKKVWEKADKALQALDRGASVTEIISKVAAYKYMTQHPGAAKRRKIPEDLRDTQIAIDVQNKAGTPNFRKRGVLNWLTNNIFPFSTVGRSGLKATYASIREDPRSYAWKTATFNLGPAMLRWGIRGGLLLGIMEAWRSPQGIKDYIGEIFSDDEEKRKHLQSQVDNVDEGTKNEMKSWADEMIGTTKYLTRMYKGIPQYDMDHYNVIPMYLRKDGKTVYLRLPQDYEGEFLTNLAGKIMGGKVTGPKGAINALWQFQPFSTNPFLSNPIDAFKYYGFGINPTDSWTGRKVLSRREREAGGEYAAKRLAQHAWDQMGGRVWYQPAWGRLETERGPWEEFLNTTPGNVLGTFVKISDRGLAEDIYEEIDKVREREAVESLETEDAFIKLVNGEQISTKEALRILATGEAQRKQKLIDMLTRKAGNVYQKALMNANTKEEKAAALKVILEQNYAQQPYSNDKE